MYKAKCGYLRHAAPAAVLALIVCAECRGAGQPTDAGHRIAKPAALPEQARSTLVADDKSRSIDIGTVRTEDEAKCVFHVVNDAGGTVSVKRVRASCGCTSAEISKSTLQRGDVADLVARISTDEYEGGKDVKVRIEGAVDGKPAQYDFAIPMQVARVLEFPSDKFQIEVGTMNVDRAHVYDLPIARGAHPMDWDGLKVDSDSRQLTALAEAQGAGKWRIRLSIDPQRRIGPFAANLKFHVLKGGVDTGYAASRRVTATVVGPARAAPNSWLIGEAAPGRIAEQSIHIISAGSDEEQLEFLGATPSNRKTIETVRNATEKDRFTIRYAPPKTLGPDSGYVDARVSTLHGAYTIRIRYLALVVSSEPAADGPTPTLAEPREPDGHGASP